MTTNKGVSEMVTPDELLFNSCYMEDGAARYRNYVLDIGARELARKLLKEYAGGDDAFTCDEDFDNYMVGCLAEGMGSITGLIALFHHNIWVAAGLREALKVYEDLEEQGRILRLPCRKGDTVFGIVLCDDGEYHVFKMEVCSISLFGDVREGKVWNMHLQYGHTKAYRSFYDFGKTIFLTQEDAETVLQEMNGQADIKYKNTDGRTMTDFLKNEIKGIKGERYIADIPIEEFKSIEELINFVKSAKEENCGTILHYETSNYHQGIVVQLFDKKTCTAKLSI